MGDALLKVNNLKKYFPVTKGIFQNITGHIKAVESVSFQINSGKTLGLVGESGCGKTTTGNLIMSLEKPTSGNIYFKGKDILLMNKNQKKELCSELQMIFQDPFGSLHPRMNVEKIISEPIRVNKIYKKNQIKDKVCEILELVGLKSDQLKRYPHQFSGGQRQRIGIARALTLRPKLLIADEPVSALDVSIQAQVLNLMIELQEKLNLSFLFISHDLSVIEHVSDEVAVMYLGKIVEYGSCSDIFSNPKHPYTKALLSAIPKTTPGKIKNRILLKGDVPSPLNHPQGCNFHTRCIDFKKGICDSISPELIDTGNNHKVACVLYS
jgi:oligopeptide/dipeptide ABC transporter ATP-binding protein